MDEQEFKNLIKDKPVDQQKKGILLYNGMVKSATAYQTESIKVNLLNWKASEEALEEFIAKLNVSGGKDAGNNLPAFKNRIEVLKYLKDQGAKVGKSKLYNDSESGKLRMRPDGSVLLSDVDLYIRAYLSPKKKGGAAPEIEDLQRDNLEKQNKKLDEQIKKLEWEREKETGKHILRDDFEREIVARAAVFEISLKQMITSKIYDWISVCQGNHAQANSMADMINQSIDNVLNDYASTDKFQVLINRE